MDLNINFAGVPFENPFTVAASPSSDSREKVRRALEAGWGGIVFKTTALPQHRAEYGGAFLRGQAAVCVL